MSPSPLNDHGPLDAPRAPSARRLISGDFGWKIVPQIVKIMRNFFGILDSGGGACA